MNQNEQQHEDHPSHAEGLIWVDDTTRAGATSRLQRQFDAIADMTMAKFSVRPFKPFFNKPRLWGMPYGCRVIQHLWGDDAGTVREQCCPIDNMWAFDLFGLHGSAPYNHKCLADICLRYDERDGRIVPDWDQQYQYFSAMRLDDLESCGVLAQPHGRRERGVVALVEERSGLVLPLPSECVVYWAFYGNGSGVEIAVYDGVAMRRRMDRYPEYFDEDIVLNEDDVERDIAGCIEVLEQLESGFLTQPELRKRMPRYPFAQSDRATDTTKTTTIKERN
ncbi:hypothetical protein [Bifidobacterium leontopitheci]|uniref:Uncharacterized protein n=1 Tax=Bifidobacterium leontopitheci TaxID=2650774 RepID=A0A6I1GER8_9BIFI|nr:hypothetical protein [Bifidobacterium leontopitheci]KAB7790035.1 hypothetical protein F7D09_1453 [Bifidobacterium leontopitheci]